MENQVDSKEHRAKLLIVDDNKQNIEILMELFRGSYKIAAARNAQRALKLAISDSPPDIILSDILMPDMDGYEFCAKIKEDQRTKHIPIIFITAVSEIMDENRGFALGAVDYITKPFHPPMVKARVKLHLNLKRKQELLEKYAFIDALTEIPNRRRFNEVIEKEWRRASRSGYPISLLFIDVDYFKEYNDTYGHGKGDECLRRIASAMARTLRRAGDFIGRYGGEEFAVVLPDTKSDKAVAMAKNLQKAVDDIAIFHGASSVASHVTISIGIATVRPDDKDISLTPKNLIDAADKKMYEAKSRGRHQIAYE
ncbi:diguanylate cyclase [uncultured Desulfobacter sp.]|uniref:GGDEF domain-containing response regulator n=1 Tax=uncultured Desulfobacter sp. TaxID=240139 RepID=UPI0029C8AEF6|nr:diguanylate cyclase [uncultured Desulfobacter sp.]